MKSRCRQSLLFVAFLLLSLTSINAAEAELKSQNQFDQNTWVSTYDILSDYEIQFTIDKPTEQQFPAELELMLGFLKGFSGVTKVLINHSEKTIEVFSNSQIELPQNINK